MRLQNLKTKIKKFKKSRWNSPNWEWNGSNKNWINWHYQQWARKTALKAVKGRTSGSEHWHRFLWVREWGGTRATGPCNPYRCRYKFVAGRYDEENASRKSKTSGRISVRYGQKMEAIQKKYLSKIEEKLEANTEKLQEIHKSVSKRITNVEEKVSILEKNRWHESNWFGSSPLSVFKLQLEKLARRNGWEKPWN